MVAKMKPFILLVVLVLVSALTLFATSNGGWLNKVPAREREKTNPYQDQADAIAAGRRVYVDHCAHCHGDDAEGLKKHPSLRSARVQQEATEGDLHWLLVNGSMGYGMPTWKKLGDPQVWQVITYVRSLHVDQASR
jgi:mono/diheme cytochrome c family protein